MQAPDNPDDQKQCWVCFASADDDLSASWVKPCKCRGTTKWVHQSCLQRWVDEKQKGNTFAKVTCSQCGSEYLILYPPLGLLTVALENVDRLVARLCPLVTAGVVFGAVYWAAVSYGAVTVFVVFGHSQGLEILQLVDYAFLLCSLPFIPVVLIGSQMFRWEDDVVRILARFTLNRDAPPGHHQQQPVVVRDQTASATRILCTALAIPVISKVVGKFLFEDCVKSHLYQTLLGGAVFLTVKGVANVYYKYQQLWRRKRRVILDYINDDVTPQQAAGPAAAQGNGQELFQP